jgi:hypothetical protein
MFYLSHLNSCRQKLEKAREDTLDSFRTKTAVSLPSALHRAHHKFGVNAETPLLVQHLAKYEAPRERLVSFTVPFITAKPTDFGGLSSVAFHPTRFASL